MMGSGGPSGVARGTMSALLVLLATTLLPVGAGAERPPTTQRLLLSIGVLPQFEQFLDSTSFPAEVYSVELLVPSGRRSSAASGRLVVTTPRRTRGPSCGVIRRPIRPISPRPASRATSGHTTR